MWYRKYRILLVIYGICLLVGVREYLVNRDADTFGWLSPEGQELTGIIAELNPDDPETEFLLSMQSLANGDAEDFTRKMEAALAADIKHSEMLLRFHAQWLLDTGAEWSEINQALNRWHRNYPFSREIITLALASGPVSESEQALWEHSLSQVPWLADFRLYSTDGGSWRLDMLFRRGHRIDIREVVRAVSLRFSY